MFLNQTMHFTLRWRGDVKRMLEDYQGALDDLDKADVFEPNNAFTLRSRGDVKRILKDYQGALEDLTRLMFLNQTMHSLCKAVEMSNEN
jgi:tetratricopeptide (TPR) repeat protein